jgi:hypothetical protein
MKLSVSTLVVGVLLVIVVIYFFTAQSAITNRVVPENKTSEDWKLLLKGSKIDQSGLNVLHSKEQAPENSYSPVKTKLDSPHAFPTIKKGQPIPELFPHQEEREVIHKLASSYNPQNIPAIAAYLLHTDETVRGSATNGLVQIGDAAAIPYLKNAERRSKNAIEMQFFRDSIRFLELTGAVNGESSTKEHEEN